MHLSDAFIQSDLQCIQVIHLYYQYMCSLGIEPITFALLTQCSNHWATGTHICIYVYNQCINKCQYFIYNLIIYNLIRDFLVHLYLWQNTWSSMCRTPLLKSDISPLNRCNMILVRLSQTQFMVLQKTQRTVIQKNPGVTLGPHRICPHRNSSDFHRIRTIHKHTTVHPSSHVFVKSFG